MAVGQNVLRKEGYEKLTGAARYIDDIALDGMLYGKTIRSRVARGRIKSITFDTSLDWSSIIVAQYRDIPGENFVALIENDQPLLVEEDVRHHDEPILLIAAETRQLAEQAARAINIEYEELEPVLTIEESLKCSEPIYGSDNVFKRSEPELLLGFPRAGRVALGLVEVVETFHVIVTHGRGGGSVVVERGRGLKTRMQVDGELGE